MASNFAYKNTRDLKFILKEWLPLGKVLAYDRYRDNYAVADVDMLLDTVWRITKEMIEPSSDDGEKHPVRFENGQVIVPPTIPPIFKKLQSEGWAASNVDNTPGAVVLPQVVMFPLWEMLSAANPSLTPPFMAMTQGVSMLVQEFASPDIKAKLLPKLFNGEYAGTMCLTEPTAGSDVGDILSKAYPTEDPRVFKLKGQKIFISDGDNNFSENIIHMFLARVEGAVPGTRGISLFIVPKYWIEDDGSLTPNDVTPTGIEHKMGSHGNPTVALSFGDNNNCRGYLLGVNPLENEGRGDGMALMFNMMNEERLVTGAHCAGLTANAFYNARDYAKERVQGAAFTNPRAGRVPIIQHEDIKRALLRGKAHAEAMRAMTYYTYLQVEIKNWDPDPAARKKAEDQIAVNIPLCKAYSSEEAWDLIGAEALQVYGGYGYCSDYPVEKLARDVKVNTLWEGTTYIQAMDLVGRKWTMEKGTVFARWFNDIREFHTANSGNKDFVKEFNQLGRALDAYVEIQQAVVGFSGSQPGLIPVYAKRILKATAQLYAGRLLLDQALLASHSLKELPADHYDVKFYRGKVLAARWYLLNVVPEVAGLAEIIKLADDSVLEIDIECFDY